MNLKYYDKTIKFYYWETANAGHYFVGKNVDNSEFQLMEKSHAKFLHVLK